MTQTTGFPDGFLWGAATAAHQVEGNNVNSDFWASEASMPGSEFSGDACDSYHRYGEDMQLLADAGYNAYRFSIEWARIEPRQGMFSNAELAHYRRMIDTAISLGLTPVVTLHHFTHPAWFSDRGGWSAPDAVDLFRAYVEATLPILDGVEWICTMNEPNMLAMMATIRRAMAQRADSTWQSPTVDKVGGAEGADGAAQVGFVLPPPDPEIGAVLVKAHHAVRDLVRERTGAKVGWTVANRAYEVLPGGEETFARESWIWEDQYLEAARGDDFVGVQSYSTITLGPDGVVKPEPQPNDTLVGTPYRPDAVGIAIRHTTEVTEGVPVVVTENGIATKDDEQRIAYFSGALDAVRGCLADGIDVRGYLAWSLLDNYEWGHWAPTFGLIAVDRTTFVRTPKPSFAWLGRIAQTNGR